MGVSADVNLGSLEVIFISRASKYTFNKENIDYLDKIHLIIFLIFFFHFARY